MPGSGFHDNDPNSPQRNGQPAIDTHVVAFQGKWDTAFVGEDADTVADALEAFAREHGKALADETADPTLKAAVRTAREYAEADTKGGKLAVRNQQFNDVLHALTLAKVGVTATAAD